MNRRLFLSWHSVLAFAVVAGFVVWMITAGLSPGRGPGYHRGFLLATGWTTLGLFSVVVTHVARKYAHKLGVSPEFRMRTPIEDLERAETALNEIRRRVMGGALSARADIHRAAMQALKQHGVQKVLRIQLEPGTRVGDPSWRVLALPTFPLGKMFHWMHAHLFYGIAAILLILLHAGVALRPGMGGYLEVLALFVAISGVVGVYFWSTGPAKLTERERDLTTEKAFALDQNLRRKVEAAFEAVDPALHPELKALQESSGHFEDEAKQVRAKLVGGGQAPEGLYDLLALLGQQHAVRVELRALRRIRMRMHAWRVLHIPAAIILLVFVALHVYSVFAY